MWTCRGIWGGVEGGGDASGVPNVREGWKANIEPFAKTASPLRHGRCRRGTLSEMLNMAQTLAELFASARSPTIEWDGAAAHAMWEVAPVPEQLAIEFRSATAVPAQGLAVKLHGGMLRANGVEAKHLTLWQDTAPREVRLVIAKKGDAKLRIWNIWREAVGGRMSLRLGWATPVCGSSNPATQMKRSSAVVMASARSISRTSLSACDLCLRSDRSQERTLPNVRDGADFVMGSTPRTGRSLSCPEKTSPTSPGGG